MDLFRVRLNCIDHYQAVPTEFDPQLPRIAGPDVKQQMPKVPVIRVFGATETGQKVCAHIHGAFPYLFIEYDGPLMAEEVDAYIRRLHISIDHALGISYRRNLYDGATAFVAHIGIVKGIPFYGYHVGYKFFLKMHLYNPLHVSRLADLLRQGTIMKKAIQPYESHLQYLLQWMCDYNLYGCAYIDCGTVKFRSPVPSQPAISKAGHQWHEGTIPASFISEGDRLPRQSHCSIEVDVCVQNVLNRLDIKQRNLHSGFMKETNSSSQDAKLVHSMAGLWRDETRRRKARMGEMDVGRSPFPSEVLVSVSADPRDTQPGGWIHEQEYLDKVGRIVKDEARKHEPNVTFDDFVQETPFEAQVKTVYESVEDLFPANLSKFNPSPEILQTDGRFTEGLDLDMSPFGIDVDESRIPNFASQEHSCDSDGDLDSPVEQDDERRHSARERYHDTLRQTALLVDGNDMAKSHNARNARSAMEEGREAANLEDISVSDNHNGSEMMNSSSEMASRGVRNAGDYRPSTEDAFAIPLQYASSINAAIAQHTRGTPSIDDSVHPTKRQKIRYCGEPTNGELNARQRLTARQGPEFEDEIKTANTPLSFLEEQPSRSLAPGHGNAAVHKERATHNLGHLSQDAAKTDGARATVRLPFPVGQNPQDPHTSDRLSQQQKSTRSPSPQSLTSGTTVGVKEVSPSFLNTLSQIRTTFHIKRLQKIMSLAAAPPAMSDFPRLMRDAGRPHILYQDAHYSDEHDVPERVREYAGKEFKRMSNTLPFLPDFNPSEHPHGEKSPAAVLPINLERRSRSRRRSWNLRTWEIDQRPPTLSEVQVWLADEAFRRPQEPSFTKRRESRIDRSERSQVDGPTPGDPHGFKYSLRKESTSVRQETQYMSAMSLEVHVSTRGSLVPNPEQDQICCVFWCLQTDDGVRENANTQGIRMGIIARSGSGGLARKLATQTAAEVDEESTELGLINRVIDMVRDHDPDILVGFEVHGGSWGYVIERARFMFDSNLCDELSRVKSQSHSRFGREHDKWGFNQTSTIRVTGRHVINVWRAMRGELNLLQYTMENIVFHLLHRRIPHHTFQDLTQ
ncbi:MAG: DNA polymerase zeta, partial [Icmadophila ericetorum]|nr:DNA polymerase zeta [Icmadophila ericetorum]